MKEFVLEQIEEAVQLEEDGFHFYTGLASGSHGLVKDMFVALAGDEARHKATFIMMRDSFKRRARFVSDGELQVRRLPLFEEVREEFGNKKRYEKAAIDSSFGQTTVADTLNIALAAEQKSVDHYRGLLEHARDMDLIVSLERIISEEVIHLKLLEAQRDHLREYGFWFRPEEFYHFRRTTEQDMRDFLLSEGYDIPSPVTRDDVEWEVNE
ncbi:MAG: hypothetical protein L0Z54_06165 [Thermoplasmata archaeon]|nr:hypothetical protein [Thermoplasmata archaeon]